MLVEILVTSASISLAALVTFLMSTMLHNYKAHQFFKLKSPNLPVFPNPNIFTGNMMQLFYAPRNYLRFAEAHKKYGKSFGFYHRDEPWVSSIDLDLIKTMVIDEPNSHNDKKPIAFPVKEFVSDSILFAGGDQWRRLRKATAPAFTNYKIKAPNVKEEIDEIASKFIESIDWRLDEAKKRGEESVVEDVEDICHRFSLSMVFGCFYKQYDIIDLKAKKDWWIHTIEISSKRFIEPMMILALTFPIINPLIDRLLGEIHPQGRIRTKMLKFINTQTRRSLEARKQSSEMQKNNPTMNVDQIKLKDGSIFKRNLIDNVIDSLHDKKITTREYIHTTFFVFFAAHKTPADALSKIIYHLAIYPDVQDKLRECILKEGTESEYLTWVMNETMRLFPPVIKGCSRTISRDIMTESGLIPAGTFVLTPSYVIHRLPEYWGDDANEFKPERWAKAKDFHPVQFIPFGAGKRICIGKDFAMHIIKLLLVELLSRYKLEATPETDRLQEFEAPFFMFDVFDLPTYIKILRLK